METGAQKIIFEMVKYRYGNTSFEELEKVYTPKADEEVMILSDRLRINGFLFHIFQREELRQFASAELRAHVKTDAKRIAIENQFLEMKGIEIIKLLQVHQVPVIWFKGNPNIQWIYKDYAMRSTSDLDFLVRKEDRMKAASLIKEQGFEYPKETMDERGVVLAEEELAEWFHEMHYRKDTPVMPLNLDLHLDLTGFPQGSIPKSIYHLDDRNWLQNISEMTLQGEKVPVLRAEDALMQMIVHYSIHHSFCGLKWLIDLCEVLFFHQDELDWNYMKDTYNHPNERKLMGICFRMVEEVTGVDRFGGEPWQAYWTARNTDREYQVYRSFAFEHTKDWRMKIQGRFAKIFIPAIRKDRWKMFYYYFGSGEAIAQRTGRKPGGNPIGHLFALAGVFLKDRKKKGQ